MDLDGDGMVGMALAGEATMEMVGDIMVITETMSHTIMVAEEEMVTIMVEEELQIDLIHHVQVLTLGITLHDHTTLHQDLKTQLQDHKTLHLEKVLTHQEPTHNHLEHQHLEIIALLQEVIITHHQEVLQAEVSEAEVVLAAEAEEAEEVN